MLEIAAEANASIDDEESTRPDQPIARAVNLSFNVARALAQPRLRVFKSIFGPWGTLESSRDDDAPELVREGDLLKPLERGHKVLVRAFIPQWLIPVPAYHDEPWSQPPRIGTGLVGHHEEWFFVNGICTNQEVAIQNAQELSTLFKRQVNLLYNRTDGVLFDLIECAAGKAWDKMTDGARQALGPLVSALCNPKVKRVILVSHSQGTIMAAVLLKTLEEAILKSERKRTLVVAPKRRKGARVSPERRAARRILLRHREDPAVVDALTRLTRADIGKLELYCFANCATSMEPFVALSDGDCPPRHAPWIESYGNEFDLVAQLGMLTPAHGVGSSRILGDRYERKGARGHLLNAHYLAPLIEELDTTNGTLLEPFHDNLRTRPRLHDYLDGKSPDSYWLCPTQEPPTPKRRGGGAPRPRA
jgi:hypothetical protein